MEYTAVCEVNVVLTRLSGARASSRIDALSHLTGEAKHMTWRTTRMQGEETT